VLAGSLRSFASARGGCAPCGYVADDLSGGL